MGVEFALQKVHTKMCHHFWGDASFLLTIEVFLLTVRLLSYGGGTVSKKDHPISGRGEP